MPLQESDPSQRQPQAEKGSDTPEFALPQDHPLVKATMDRQRRFATPLSVNPTPETLGETVNAAMERQQRIVDPLGIRAQGVNWQQVSAAYEAGVEELLNDPTIRRGHVPEELLPRFDAIRDNKKTE